MTKRKLDMLCTDKGCPTLQNYKEGGIRGKCIKHGGSPLCTNEECTTSSQQYKNGGTHGKCTKHGGFPLCTNKGCHKLRSQLRKQNRVIRFSNSIGFLSSDQADHVNHRSMLCGLVNRYICAIIL